MSLEQIRKDVEKLYKTTKLEPRPYQLDVVSEACWEFLENNSNSVFIEEPPGAGKTSQTLMIVKYLQLVVPTIKYTAWTSMRNNLLTQAAVENVKMGINANVDQYFKMRTDLIPSNIDILINDEGHHDACDTFRHIHNVAKPRWTILPSATAYRSDKLKIICDKVIKSASLGTLIRDGYLAQYKHFTITDWNIKTVVGMYLKYKDMWGKSIMYFSRRMAAYKAANYLRRKGIRCEAALWMNRREEHIDKLANGELELLTNCQSLTEGMNIVDLNTVFVKDSSKGPTYQMAGRVFRKCPSIEYKNVVQSKQSKYPFTRVAAPQGGKYLYTDEEFRLIEGKTKKTETIQMNTINVIKDIKVELPQYVKDRSKKMNRRRFNQRRHFG